MKPEHETPTPEDFQHMNAIVKDTPISFGIAREALQLRCLEEVGACRRKLRDLRADPQASQFALELAESELEEARAKYAIAQRADDGTAREMLAKEGIRVCKR